MTTTDQLTTYRVEFDRIGRSHDVAPLVTAARDADDLAAKIHRYARPRLASRHPAVFVDMNTGRGWISVGFRVGATFTVTTQIGDDQP